MSRHDDFNSFIDHLLAKYRSENDPCTWRNVKAWVMSECALRGYDSVELEIEIEQRVKGELKGTDSVEKR